MPGKPKTLIVHIHGGGFIALSSRTHQSYLRKWAKMVPNSVVMSIDYRLAPRYEYPTAIEDVWQGYYWILRQCEAQLGIPIHTLSFIGISPRTILVTGDSAGGCLTMNLTLRAIHTGLRIPNGLVLGYPGTQQSTVSSS